ncbi:adenosine deaminase [Microbacterium endophyticum]|uniref:Adenosine deaminase n=1 Tax=Microbacterium endophyticum TaxID=1526412 RepID=A0A7W4V5D9_9MICO|nr:adenosine deaminase [Microbacterium endophyticum]MBB2977130.1 adenosine deaminase [Microbacterium endophyticum]NIK36058.1 adenosine deaminase [Microbacterium endophyticum]
MISGSDYLQLLPKTELHCHFASTLTAPLFIELAAKYGVELWADNADELFAFDDLADFLVAFRAAHDVLREPDDFARVAREGVRHAVAAGNLRYREYFINPQYFAARGLSYADVIDPLIAGLRQAERDYGVGFRVVVAINRQESPESAVELVRQVVAHGAPEVVGIGQDDLTPEGTEDPTRFVAAYRLAREHGLKLTAHVGETDNATPDAVREAIEVLECDRLDHGYRIMDDPSLVRLALTRGIAFTATPVSTTICSGWVLDPSHRIRAMIDAGLKVTLSTDDALFFRTDLGREYREGLTLLGVDMDAAKQIAINGIDAAFCSEDEKARMRAEFTAQFLALDTLRVA